MQYPYTSVFPNGIDERTFFCDISIDDIPIMETYNNLINNGKYTEANIFLSQQKVHHYSADLLNYIEVKIFNWQNEIIKKEKHNPFHHSSTEPIIPVGEFWIGK